MNFCDAVGQFFSGMATFFILLLGLALIFTAGPVVGCLTVLGLALAWAYVRTHQSSQPPRSGDDS